MADRSELEEMSLQQLREEVTCGVCHEFYTDPKVLPCLHYYCKKCIFRLSHRAGSSADPFYCPECRTKTSLPEGGVEDLKTAFFVNRIKSTFSTLQRIHGEVGAICEGCNSGSLAESFCRQCTFFICNGCVESHHKMVNILGKHTVVSVQDLREGKARVSDQSSKAFPAMKCESHHEDLKVFCFDCDTLICRDCTMVDHKSHQFQFCSRAAPEVKGELTKKLEPLEQTEQNLVKAVEEVRSTRLEVEAQGRSVALTIDESFSELVKILERRKEELLEESKLRVQEKVEKLTVQEKTLSLACAEVQSVISYTKRCLDHCSHSELMSAQVEIRKRINQELQVRVKKESYKKPSCEADVGVEVTFAESLQDMCQCHARITLQIDQARFEVTGEGLRTAQINLVAEVVLAAEMLSTVKPTQRHPTIAGRLKSLHNGLEIPCVVGHLGLGRYTVQYTAMVRGRHELHLSVNGQQVTGSPFSVLVSAPPSDLGKPVKVIYDVRAPTSIAQMTSGEIIVGKDKGDIMAHLKDGKIRFTGRDHLRLGSSSVAGLDVDQEGFLYLTLYDFSSILKLDKDCQVLRETDEQGTWQFGLAVVGDEVMVCPTPAKGTIAVYDRNLQYVRKIYAKNTGQFRDISPDSCGNVFVSDWSKKRVHVFTVGGILVRSFGCPWISMPLGLCVSNQYVYVCNNGRGSANHCVLIFTVQGEYITSLGQKGSHEGCFNIPQAICADRNGFLYVCDHANDRIQVF